MSSWEILVITSFPPRKCGIATYSQDLIHALEDKYHAGFTIKICALQNNDVNLDYSNPVKYVLKTWGREDYIRLAKTINSDSSIRIIYLQHEFGLYGGELGADVIDFLKKVNAPVITTFHTILSSPADERKKIVQQIAELSCGLIVMTKLSAEVLQSDYQISENNITVIPHGTHLIKPHKPVKRKDVPLPDKVILSTFGIISEGKSIETALDALPAIVGQFSNVLYLIIGKTHPEVFRNEGEKYRDFLHNK